MFKIISNGLLNFLKNIKFNKKNIKLFILIKLKNLCYLMLKYKLKNIGYIYNGFL